MSYCVTPGCFTPYNPDLARFCLSCGSKLLLRERYRSIQPIGRGGFGITFLAVDEDIPSKPRCVIKQLYLQSQGSLILKKAVQLFHQEAEHLDELGEHPQIPKLLAHFEENKRLYLVQELIEGETLEQELQRVGVFKETQIWELLQDVLPVLKFVHERQVIHRDIKPANIIRRRSDGKLVLIDFGVAKLISGTALLHTGTTVGSAEYMSPEQTKGKAFPASDLYSLGVTCIYLLTGISPFNLFDIINNRWAWRNYLPSGKGVSDRLGKILDGLLEDTLKERYQSADAVLQALNSKQRASNIHIQRTPNQTLVSEVGIDYTRLQDLLQRKKWKEADQQTWDALCQMLGKAPGYYLKTWDIEHLPCEDLWTIDQLWVKYSNGRFGFSIQKHIYQDTDEDYLSFCDRVGWPPYDPNCLNSTWNFNLKAPVGHLPSRRWVGGYSWWRHAGALAAKLEQCGIS
jgi:serine/threonine protein kinase